MWPKLKNDKKNLEIELSDMEIIFKDAITEWRLLGILVSTWIAWYKITIRRRSIITSS